jgi:hypothetical protein
VVHWVQAPWSGGATRNADPPGRLSRAIGLFLGLEAGRAVLIFTGGVKAAISR